MLPSTPVPAPSASCSPAAPPRIGDRIDYDKSPASSARFCASGVMSADHPALASTKSQHIEERPRAEVPCRHCGVLVLRAESTAHEASCSRRRVACADCAELQMPACETEQHTISDSACPDNEAVARAKQCRQRMKRSLLACAAGASQCGQWLKRSLLACLDIFAAGCACDATDFSSTSWPPCNAGAVFTASSRGVWIFGIWQPPVQE